MIDLDTLVHRMMALETKYYELQSKYQTLIHQYEELKNERSESLISKDYHMKEKDGSV